MGSMNDTILSNASSVFNSLPARPKVGDKRECADRQYFIGEHGEWRRADMTVKEKRAKYHRDKNKTNE